MRKRRRIGQRVLKGFAVALVLVVLVIALGTLVPRGESRSASASVESSYRQILILSNAIHTDLALPLDVKTRDAFGFVELAGLPIGRPDAEWLILGWGGEQFYVRTPEWADLEVLPVVQSILGDRSVMHVELAGAIDPDAPFVKPLTLSSSAYDDLLEAILGSFQSDANELLMPMDVEGYGNFDRFYQARGGFQVLFGCNTWTGQMLREAGIATGAWTPLPFLLRLSIDLHN